MVNLKAKDADSVTRYVKASGDGTEQNPLIVEHADLAVLTKLDVLSTSANQLTEIARLEQIRDALAEIKTYTDGLETLITTLNSYADGLEALLGTANTTQSSIGGFVDQLEGFVDGVEPKLDSILTELQGKAKLTDTQPVTVNNFPASQAVSGTVGVNNFPTLQSITDNQTTYTETIFTLAANATFTGTGHDAQNKNTVRGWAWTNVSGTLYFEQSTNNTTWRVIEIVSVAGSGTQATDFVFRLNARYYRLRYVNGLSNQTTFELISTVFGVGL